MLVNPDDTTDRDDEDRVVTRRVDHPTEADPGDDAVYRAANPQPDDDPSRAAPADGGGPRGGTTERAADELDGTAESEPTRSE